MINVLTTQFYVGWTVLTLKVLNNSFEHFLSWNIPFEVPISTSTGKRCQEGFISLAWCHMTPIYCPCTCHTSIINNDHSPEHGSLLVTLKDGFFQGFQIDQSICKCSPFRSIVCDCMSSIFIVEILNADWKCPSRVIKEHPWPWPQEQRSEWEMFMELIVVGSICNDTVDTVCSCIV